MIKPLVGCLCVSCRPRFLPLAMACFEAQTYERKRLLILPYTDLGDVLRRMDEGCELLFNAGCDYVAAWDDDDYSPVDRLELSVQAAEIVGHDIVVGYDGGWFMSIRSLRSEWVDLRDSGHLWGGSLMFDSGAYGAGFVAEENTFPGQDRQLQERAGNLITLPRGVIRPIALCYGRNVATFMRNRGKDRPVLLSSMPPKVRQEVFVLSSWFNENNIHVPEPEV